MIKDQNMPNQTQIRLSGLCVLLCVFFVSGAAADEPLLTPDQRDAWKKTLAAYDYVTIAHAYADYMIEHGRDTYGPKHTPLFVTGIDRKTGKRISPPFAHVKRKPFMPGWERDRELRGWDRNHGNADPLDQLTLLKIMHRLSEMTGDPRYAAEADKTAAWWMANTQTGIGLYPWGTHTSWNVDKEGGGGTFEFNHVWPYWDLNPSALQKYAMGLWNHYVADKNTGNFNRHANSNGHGPGGGMEFPWPGSAMIATWVEAYLANPDPEYVRAIDTILNRWESLRDKNGHLAPCSSYGEWAWYEGYAMAANVLDDWADRIETKEPKLAERMRDYGRRCDAAYLKLADHLLDIKRVGPVMSYLRATGDYNPDRLDILGGPWHDRKDYAFKGLLLYERMKRNKSEALQKRFRPAVLDTAEIYMSINPEVQWSVWGENTANAIRLMLAAHEMTGNTAYLHRADHFARLAVKMFLDDTSPLPKLTSQDDYYEIESVSNPSSDVWMLAALEVHERMTKVDEAERHTARIATDAGVWDCTKLTKPVASVSLGYGEDGERTLFLSRVEKGFAPDHGLPIDGLDLIVSDHVNSIPTLEQVKPFNGAYRRKFSGKHREPSTAEYGGFKDVLDSADLTLVNHGKQPATVRVTATYHDSWDDRETKEHTHTIAPGERVIVECAAPEKRFIRRIDFDSTIAGGVKLERFAFEMTPRSKLNPIVAANVPKLGSAFRDAEPKLTSDGLVVHLGGSSLASVAEGSPIGTWPNSVKPELSAKAKEGQRPALVRVNGLAALRFDGRDDFLSIPDHDALDLSAWTLIVHARPMRGPGVILSKTDERNMMANYRLQIDDASTISALVRGSSVANHVNRSRSADALNRFAVMAARFDPNAKGKEQISIGVDGRPSVYTYEVARGNTDLITHDRPLEIGRQPGREPRYFHGDITEILLYNRALSDDEINSTARWLYDKKTSQQRAKTTDGATKPRKALVFLIAGQSNAGGVAAFSPEANVKAGLHEKHPTIPGSTAKEVGIPTTMEAYPRSYIWGNGFESLTPGKNLKGGYRDPWRHGIELPMAMLLEKQHADADIFFIKHGPAGHNLHTQWKANNGPDYKTFTNQLKSAMADLKKRYDEVRVIGLYWDQGESDRPKANEYEANLKTLFASLRNDTAIPDLQIFVRKHLFQHGDESFAPIIDAQVKIAKEDPNTVLLDLDLGSSEKNFKVWAWTDGNGHLSSKAYLELAQRILSRSATLLDNHNPSPQQK